MNDRANGRGLERGLVVGLIAGLFFVLNGHSAESPYDPLRIDAAFQPAVIDCSVHDEARKRDLPLRIYLPAATREAPVVLFSHGLKGSRENNPYLGRHWAARGYVAVFVQHPGSDESVWKDKPAGERLAALKKAVGIKNFNLRVKDVSTVIDRLEEWNGQKGHALAGRLDLKRIGMSGHSFGAVTTQAVSGQTYLLGLRGKTDPRIRASVMFSPSAPKFGRDPAKAFSEVKIPWLLMTGTKDVSLIGDADLASRLAVFPALPPGGKYELVLEGAEHSAFGDRPLPGDKEARNPNHHRAILALSTAFWDAYLRSDPAAIKWLDGSGPRAVLEPKDRWQKK